MKECSAGFTGMLYTGPAAPHITLILVPNRAQGIVQRYRRGLCAEEDIPQQPGYLM